MEIFFLVFSNVIFFLQDVNIQQEVVKFVARPVPKKILEGPVGVAEKKLAPLTEPKSPSFRADALKRAKEVTRRVTPVKHMNKVVMKVLEASNLCNVAFTFILVMARF